MAKNVNEGKQNKQATCGLEWDQVTGRYMPMVGKEAASSKGTHDGRGEGPPDEHGLPAR